MVTTQHLHDLDGACLLWGRARQYHVGWEIFCRRGSLEESFNQLPWQSIDALGTEGAITEGPVKYEPEVWGWSLPDRVLVGAAACKCPATHEGQ